MKPWENEPDQKGWRAHGLWCTIHRHPYGKHLCGYVDVPPGHPCHGIEDEWGGRGLPNLDVHGGVTWTEWLTEPYTNIRIRINFRDHDIKPQWLRRAVRAARRQCYRIHTRYLRWVHRRDAWRIGFDCAHAWDLSPGIAERYGWDEGIYRDMAYVTEQTENLARQLAELAGDAA